MEKFTLQHTVLYAKGWYKRTDFWGDVSKCLEADGYIGTFIGDSLNQIKNRAAYIIVSQFERLPNKGHANSLSAFYEGIKPYNVWKVGYYTKDYTFLKTKEEIANSPEYDYNEAVVRYCLSYFLQLSKDEWDVCYPNPKTCLKLNDEVNYKKIKEVFVKH